MSKLKASMGENKSGFRIIKGKTAGKRPIGRPSHRWEKILKQWVSL